MRNEHAGLITRSAAPWLVLLAVGLAGCRDRPEVPPLVDANNTAVLGSPGPADAAAPETSDLRDAEGRPIPLPPLPGDAVAQAALTGPSTAWAIWVHEGRVVGSRYTHERGWETPTPFERIAGQDSDPQLASNGQGAAIALWRHTVGRIESLRYSRYAEATGWSGPDVLHGALPRPRPGGLNPAHPHEPTAPKLRMDAQGQAHAIWPSGFDLDQLQSSQYLRNRGWSPPVDVPVAAGTPAAAVSTR